MIKIERPLMLADKFHNMLDLACRKSGYKLERHKDGTMWQVVYTTTKRGLIFSTTEETVFARISYVKYDSSFLADVLETYEETFLDLMELIHEQPNLKVTLVRDLYRLTSSF